MQPKNGRKRPSPKGAVCRNRGGDQRVGELQENGARPAKKNDSLRVHPPRNGLRSHGSAIHGAGSFHRAVKKGTRHAPGAHMPPDPSDMSHSATRILLVEEDSRTRDLRAGILRRAGFSVIEAPTIEDAKLVEPADVILIDAQQLPLALNRRSAAPIVVIADEVRDGILACARGASDWVPRGSAAEYLISTLEAANHNRSRL
jgi:hypothetical protein